MKYAIEMSDEQAVVMQEALDLYFRLLMGQWNELGMMARIGMFRHKDGKDYLPVELYEHLDNFLQAIVVLVFGFRPGESWGISSGEIPDSARIAYDIHDVIRHQRWQDNGGDERGYSVASWPPRRLSEHEELPVIRRICK